MSLPLVDTHQLGLPGEADLAPVRKSRTAARNRPAHSHIAQLTAALRQAEAERDAKDAFLSHLIHDLRTPLSAVVGMADLLKESQLSPDQREMMRVIRGSAEHLVGMMTNALELARLDAGKVALETLPFEPLACAEDCLDLHAAAAAEKGVELGCTVSDAVPWLMGDASRLRQIMSNLVGNAVKFTATGEVLLRIASTQLPDGLWQMHVSVSDTGPGIPRERLESIFQDCTSPDFTIAGRHQRSGMGLSISRRLLDMMGGRIWAESVVGEGATFHFSLVAPASAGVAGRWRPEPGFAGKRVMIIDENVAIAGMLADALRRWNIEPVAVHDGTAALISLNRAQPFDAILIDRRIPDRRSMAAAIRQLPGGESLPLVLLTALGAKGLDESLAGTGGRARFAGYLSKPIKLNRLHEVLSRVLLGPESRRNSGTHGRLSPPTGLPVVIEAPAIAEQQPVSELAGARVVIADDEPAVRTLLERLLGAEGVEVICAPDGAAALNAVKRVDPDVVLLDVEMPELDGFEACRRLKNNPSTRLTPVVLVTGLSGTEDRVRGIEAGADDIITKPWEHSELLARLRSLVRLKRFTNDLDRVEAVLVAVAQCMESRDPDTHGHCARLSDYASRLGRRIGLDEADINALRLGGIVHDIGKVAIPDAILFKAGPLSDDEWAVMREHPVEGERICSGLASFRKVMPIIRHHHERMDGSGYPDALKGSEIPVTARVLQIVDIFDALTTKRVYKEAMTAHQALEEMQVEVDRGWRDPEIFAAFQELILEDLKSGN